MYNELLNDYELQYADFSDDKKMTKQDKFKFKDLFLKGRNYNNCFDNHEDEESDEKTLEGDE